MQLFFSWLRRDTFKATNKNYVGVGPFRSRAQDKSIFLSLTGRPVGTWDDGDLPPPGPAPVDVPGPRGLAELSASSPANSGPVVSSSSERGQRGDVGHHNLHVGQGRVGGSGA